MRDFVEVRDLCKHYPVARGSLLKAVDGISFSIRRGEVLGLVGESGCGKSTVGRLLLRLMPPTSGSVHFDGVDITALPGDEMRRMRRRMQIVFQDPHSSLNPRMTVGETLIFPMKVQHLHRGEEQARAVDLLSRVGLNRSAMNRYPHEFSGGQLQRIGIARALAVEPDFIVADEPVSSLDVSIQSQVLNLFKDLQEDLQLTILFISHNLSVVEFLCDRVAVLYMGKLVEVASAKALFRDCQHPYTQSLLAAILLPDPAIERSKPPLALRGEISTPIDPPPGCQFYARCPYSMDVCQHNDPPIVRLDAEHEVACWLHAGEAKVPATPSRS